MLSPNDVKEELSLAYVRAIASRAGFSIEEIRKNRDLLAGWGGRPGVGRAWGAVVGAGVDGEVSMDLGVDHAR